MAARTAAKKGRTAKASRKGKVKSAPARKGGARRGEGGATAKRSRRPKKQAAAKTPRRKLYTLTEVGRLASVSMPTLQKYKKAYADRIPSVGEGRRQRYPRAAVAVLRQLKKENLAKRGRPPKAGGSAAKKRSVAKSRVAKARSPKGLLTLTEISRRTKVSYPTVSRYVKLFIDRIPHVGTGRSRRFPAAAVAVFKQLRSESRPGRPPAKAGSAGSAGSSQGSRTQPTDAALSARLRQLEKAQAELSKQVATMVKLLKKPLQVTIKGR